MERPPTKPPATKKTQFILIDFENVQPRGMGPLCHRGHRAIIFSGPTQKLPYDIVSELQPFGTQVEYVQCDGGGHNALDFHIAYYIGRLSMEHAGASFHIISKDTGFDPLIKHLKAKKVLCKRWASLHEISAPKSTTPAAPITAAPKPGAEKVAPAGDLVKKVIENLAKRDHAKPRSIKTLHSTIQTFARAPLSEAAFNDAVRELERQKILTVVDGKVTYPATA